MSVPATATAALINITLDQNATLQSFLTVWPTGEPRPLTSTNNAQPGLIAANSGSLRPGHGPNEPRADAPCLLGAHRVTPGTSTESS
jgi:hypothetical protein